MNADDRRRLRLLKARLPKAWCLETTSLNCRDSWSRRKPSVGQCVPTALIVQDLFGGEIIKVAANTAGAHYYNRLPDGRILDLTKDQFRRGTRYNGYEVFTRWKLLDSPPAREAMIPRQYELLRKRLGAI